jgi:hypothetical protein
MVMKILRFAKTPAAGLERRKAPRTEREAADAGNVGGAPDRALAMRIADLAEGRD